MHGEIVGGVPARKIGTIEEYISKKEKETAKLPWLEIIINRVDHYDKKDIESLTRLRQKYFFET